MLIIDNPDQTGPPNHYNSPTGNVLSISLPGDSVPAFVYSVLRLQVQSTQR